MKLHALKDKNPNRKLSLPASNPGAKTNLKHKASGLTLPIVIKHKDLKIHETI